MDYELQQIKTSQPFLGFIESRQGGRPENQDFCGFADTLLGLLVVVCDGMGGGPGGKTASTVAVETIIQTIRSATADSNRVKAIEAAVQNAHLKLLALQKEKPSLDGMGTTATILLINKHSAIIAHVGDSRVYQLRWGRRIFRTADHSLVGELVRKKAMTEDEARMSSNSNVIQRALGVGAEVKADICERPYEKGDRFMLCTDGVWGAMKEEELTESVARTKALSGAIEKTMVKVEETGVADGGRHDNFTMALLMTTHNSILKEPMTTKTRNLLLGLTIVCGLSLIGNITQYAVRPDRPNISQTNTNDSSAMTAREQAQQKQIDELKKQMKVVQEEKDSIFIILKSIRDILPRETAKIVEDKEKKEQQEKDNLVAELEKLISQLEKLRDMLHGTEKNKLITQAQNKVKELSNELILYGMETEMYTLVELLGNDIAKSDSREPKYQKKEQYKGHWEGKNGIITRVKNIKEEITKK